MIFNIDADTAFNTVLSALESAGQNMADDKMKEIVDCIENTLPEVVGSLLSETYDEWCRLAIAEKGWGTKYIQALRTKIENNEASVYLDETVKPPFGLMMERGVKSWSIKDALLKSEKVKIGPAGVPYIIVPFPVHTPGETTHMDAKFGNRKMTKDMHVIVKGGGRIESGSITVQNTLRSFEVDVSGLTRFNSRKYHSQYGIFRCVSKNSKGWQYPDKSATPIYPSVIDYVNRRIVEVLTDYCNEVIKEYS